MGSNIFTARKRSLGQGNVFTHVCQSFCSRRGASAPLHAGIHPQGRHPWADTPSRHPWADTPWADPPPGRHTYLGRHPPGKHPTPSDTTGYGQQAGGMHPTGMHICIQKCSHWSEIETRTLCFVLYQSSSLYRLRYKSRVLNIGWSIRMNILMLDAM